MRGGYERTSVEVDPLEGRHTNTRLLRRSIAPVSSQYSEEDSALFVVETRQLGGVSVREFHTNHPAKDSR